MIIDRIELLEALLFMQQDCNEHYPMYWNAANERLTLSSHTGLKYYLDCKDGRNDTETDRTHCFGLGISLGKLVSILKVSTDVEFFTFSYKPENQCFVIGSRLRVYSFPVISEEKMPYYLPEQSRVKIGANFLTIDADKHSLLKRAKAYLSKDDYRPIMQHFIVSDSLLFATDANCLYCNKFEYGYDMMLPSFVTEPRFLDCKVFAEENKKRMYFVGKNWEIQYCDMPFGIELPMVAAMKNYYNNVCENRACEDVQIELDVERLLVACNVALIDDKAGRLVLNLQTDSDLESIVMSEELYAEIPDSYSYSSANLKIMLNSRFVMQLLQTMQLRKSDVVKFTYVQTSARPRWLFTRNKSEFVLVMGMDVKEQEITKEQERLSPAFRLERFKHSGWSTFDEFRNNNYKTFDEVELERLILTKTNHYECELKALVLINEDRVKSAHAAKEQLDILIPQIESIKQAYKQEFALSEDGQQLILLRSELNGLKKLQVSDDNTLRIAELTVLIDTLQKKYKSDLDLKTKDITREKNRCVSITIEDALLLEYNIDQVANSNSHILIKREAIQKEYDEFLLNPAKYVRTTKQVGEELKEKKGKKQVLQAA